MTVTFEPRWASAPGVTIAEALEGRGLTAEDLADALGTSDPVARRLINGDVEIDPDMASRLAGLVGGTEEFWLERERNFRQTTGWLAADQLAQLMPLNYMRDLGWLPDESSWKESAASSLAFFNVESADEWNHRYNELLGHAHYRTSSAYDSSRPSLAVWLRQASILAHQRTIAPWSPAGLRKSIASLRSLTRLSDPQAYVPRISDLCETFGVAVVFLPPPPDCVVSGAAFTTDEGVRVVALSGRHKSDDHLFFSLFHELGHQLLHGESLYVDEFDGGDASIVELEADRFAVDSLTPAGIEALRGRAKGPTMRQVVAFASHQGVAPGVVVGQLQHEGVLGYNQLNGLKRWHHWEGSTLKSGRKN